MTSSPGTEAGRRAAPDRHQHPAGLPHPASARTTRGTGRRTPDAGHRTPDAGHRTPDAGHRTPDAGHRTPAERARRAVLH
ncbi:hypothetical protein CA850_17565 [Micromonospora echinospora]|nr:hypothetical protein CA850_17565 [Micromonospora echinospora]